MLFLEPTNCFNKSNDFFDLISYFFLKKVGNQKNQEVKNVFPLWSRKLLMILTKFSVHFLKFQKYFYFAKLN